MILYDRYDGRRVRDIDPFQKTMPHVMRGRNESAVYFSEDIEVDNALKFVRQLNEESGQRIYSLFHIILAALVQILVKKPKINRFISGRSLYDRRNIVISFAVKKRLTEEARETNAKIVFNPNDTIETVTKRVNEAIERARSDELTADEKETFLLSKIPFGLAITSVLFRIFNHLNLAPSFMIDADPLFCSIYVANLASINLTTPFHHLYEWGNASVFLVIGRMERRKVPGSNGLENTRHFINFKITLDERIADGLYYAHTIDLFRRVIANPQCLRYPAREWELVYGIPCISDESSEASTEAASGGVSEKTNRVIV